MGAIEVRPARPDDRTAVFAFCARTWGDDGDYIPYVWDQWLVDTNGVLLVAQLDGQPVGLTHMDMVTADEGWIEGVRVDPSWRRQGIGRVLISRSLAAAHERGAAVVRMLTDSDNTASQQLFAKFGFERVAMFAHYVAGALTEASAEPLPDGFTLRTPGPADLERVWAFLEASNLAPLNGGLLLQGWRAQALTTEVLERRLAAGEVWTLEGWGAIQALAIAHAN
ncbi:MAG TPA: GNAT family N-acetyltransferase, partial [Ktedonobacterales bacterium]|nr:GNAT family N-acetyltransferase [Ktedonobacterales bacterium]